ncbi:hypothetical protein J8I87_15040 [Paraburkholderia sp. LEh10]|nr:hypothetical protein [Paraburkholderia sp. LEh10]MBP0591003.1 hypothetical protein [Paraburkholderia sp. LEh10]
MSGLAWIMMATVATLACALVLSAATAGVVALLFGISSRLFGNGTDQ